MDSRDGAKTWYGTVNEDGSFSVLARITALEGTGTQVNPFEGKCLKQADVFSIACAVYDLGADKDNAAGTLIVPSPTLTAAANILDTLATNGWPTYRDLAGYNFRHDVTPDYDLSPGTASRGEWYLLEYRIVLTGGGVVWMRIKVKTVPVQGS